MYLNFKGKIKLKDIAAELGVLDTQIRKWKSTDNWDDELKGTFPKKKRSVPNKKKTKKKETELQEAIEIENPDLTDKQRLFCSYWINNRNATQAYLKAYECSYGNAHAHAYKLWQNVAVKKEIDKQLKELRDELKIDTQDLIQKYIDIAFADITDFVEFGCKDTPLITRQGPIMITDEKTGETKPFMIKENILNFKDSDMVDGSLISEVKTNRQGVSIKLLNKQKALDWLADYLGMNPEHRYRKEFNDQKLQLEQEKLEHQKKMDESKVW